MLKASSHEISITSFDKNNEFQMKWEFSIATKSEHAKYDFLLKNTHTQQHLTFGFLQRKKCKKCTGSSHVILMNPFVAENKKYRYLDFQNCMGYEFGI